jgi:uncharacterized protein YcnI
MRTPSALALAATLAAAGAAQSHVLVQPTSAKPGAEQLLKFVVGHGCGGQPTTALKVVLPDGVAVLAAAPKDGWTYSLERAAAGGSTVQWRGGVLAADHADDFQLTVRLPARLGPIAFLAYQSCGDTVVGWVEPTTPGAEKPKRPALVLTLTDAPAPSAADAAIGVRAKF